MKVASLHSPLVRRTIETINAGQLEDFLKLFAVDLGGSLIERLEIR